MKFKHLKSNESFSKILTKSPLDELMVKLDSELELQGVYITKNDDTYIIENSDLDIYKVTSIYENGEWLYKTVLMLSDGSDLDYISFSPQYVIYDIKRRMIKTRYIKTYIVDKTPIDSLSKFSVSENEEDVMENSSEYNFNPIPFKKDKNNTGSTANFKTIKIGEKNPIKQFKKMSGKYWRKRGEQYKKYEPNSGIPSKELVKSLEYKEILNFKSFLKNK